MKHRYQNPWLFVLGALLVCSLSALGREVSLTFLHTTDMHGHLLPVTDYEGNENVGGLLRCASEIARVRGEESNVLLLDCGDTIQGGAESYLTDGRLMLQAMEWLKYDAWVIGNHEFDWGLKKLVPLHDATSLEMLGANIVVRPGAPHPLSRVKPYTIVEQDGVRIALVGLTTPGIPTWTLPDYLGGLLFESSVDTLDRVMPEVRAEQPDIMVLLAHQGYRSFGDDHANEIRAIARRFPEFAVILGGHTHVVQEGVDLNGVLYAQAGYHACWLGRVDLVYDTVASQVKEKTSSVIEIGETVPIHPALADLLAGPLAEARTYLDEVVGESAEDLMASMRTPAQSPMQQLLCKAIQERVQADVVIHGLLTEAGIPAGPIRRRDVWDVVPYENRICVAQLTSEELKLILAENLRHLNGRSFMGIYGLSYELVMDSQVEERIRKFRLPDGSPLHVRRRLKVAFNSYTVASGGKRHPVLREVVHRPASRLRVTDIDTRSAVEDYIRKHSPLSIAAGNEVTVIRK